MAVHLFLLLGLAFANAWMDACWLTGVAFYVVELLLLIILFFFFVSPLFSFFFDVIRYVCSVLFRADASTSSTAVSWPISHGRLLCLECLTTVFFFS